MIIVERDPIYQLNLAIIVHSSGTQPHNELQILSAHKAVWQKEEQFWSDQFRTGWYATEKLLLTEMICCEKDGKRKDRIANWCTVELVRYHLHVESHRWSYSSTTEVRNTWVFCNQCSKKEEKMWHSDSGGTQRSIATSCFSDRIILCHLFTSRRVKCSSAGLDVITRRSFGCSCDTIAA